MEQTNPSWSAQLRRRQLAAPVQALVRKNNPSQVAGTDAFKNKGFGALVQAARESQEVFETITADPGCRFGVVGTGNLRSWYRVSG